MRTKAAKGLAKAVTAELAGLAMAGADFSIARGDRCRLAPTTPHR